MRNKILQRTYQINSEKLKIVVQMPARGDHLIRIQTIKWEIASMLNL